MTGYKLTGLGVVEPFCIAWASRRHEQGWRFGAVSPIGCPGLPQISIIKKTSATIVPS
jgi:hypothetical protein